MRNKFLSGRAAILTLSAAFLLALSSCKEPDFEEAVAPPPTPPTPPPHRALLSGEVMVSGAAQGAPATCGSQVGRDCFTAKYSLSSMSLPGTITTAPTGAYRYGLRYQTRELKNTQ